MVLGNFSPQNELRSLLNLYKDRLGATNTELAEGLGISRPTLINFLKGDIKELPIHPKNLIDLFNHLCKSNGLDREKSVGTNSINQITKGIKNERVILERIGPDELLNAAGFLPVEAKSINVSRKNFDQISQIVGLLDSSLLAFEDMLNITQDLLFVLSSRLDLDKYSELYNEQRVLDKNCKSQDKLEMEELPQINSESNNYLSGIVDYLESHPTMGLKLRAEIKSKLIRARNKLLTDGKTTFNKQEVVSLYRSIGMKMKQAEDEINIHIRVIKVEFQSLTTTISEVKGCDTFYTYYKNLENDSELVLKRQCRKTSDLPSSTSKIRLNQPVTRAVTTISIGHENNAKILYWSYTSSSTLLTNAISSCALQIGYSQEITSILVWNKALGNQVNSLVESTVIIGNNYRGVWVDRDLIISTLQSFIVAGKKWLKNEESSNSLDLNIYIELSEYTADIRKKIRAINIAIQSYSFLDPICELSEISKVAAAAKSKLKEVPQQKTYLLFEVNLVRCYLKAMRLQLRLENTHGNIVYIKKLLEDVQVVAQERSSIMNTLAPMEILIQTEALLYDLSIGNIEEIRLKEYTKSRLQEWENKILSTLDPQVFYKDPGYDIYTALSETYGNIYRLVFYLSHNSEMLEQSYENFLKACHYSLRIGLTQRAAHWLVLAGRVQVRLNNAELSKQSLEVARDLLSRGSSTQFNAMFSKAIHSEINLLEGERYLLIGMEENIIKALHLFLTSLQGSTYLGFNRRIADALYNISRCAVKIGNIGVQETLSKIFKDLDSQNNETEPLNPTQNLTSNRVIDLLKRLGRGRQDSSWFDVQGDFNHLAAQIWQDWHQQAFPQSVSKHPIAKEIEDRIFLDQVKPTQI